MEESRKAAIRRAHDRLGGSVQRREDAAKAREKEAMKERERAREADAAKTAKLRALRLARDAAEAEKALEAERAAAVLKIAAAGGGKIRRTAAKTAA
ncbi:MAG: hypothetical protein IPK81_24495 [Rhodospirillales bacterium]|nr:hypothetical protein [Rhodospirillales bacterium]QQS12582.1 MAG: hypothetical protein IPK81_24495 [Rhodospirillales bacterium]